MKKKIDDFLEKHILEVKKPLRYLGGEYNAKNKPFFENIDNGINIVLAFPDLYEIGMSHLGIKLLYSILNNEKDISCDRVYFPAPDMLYLMREHNIPLFSIENRRPLNEYDIIGFSIQYELSYTTLLQMLKLSKIPLLSEERDENMPFIIIGGPVVTNSEPLANFVDISVIGEAEEAFLKITNIIRNGKKSGKKREEILKEIAINVQGAYVPGFYSYKFDEKGNFAGIIKKYEEIPEIIKRNVIDFNSYKYPDSIIVPNIEIVHNRVSLEIMRGCIRGCRFCHAGYFYRPKREKHENDLVLEGIKMLKNSGYTEISLTSLSSIDYSDIIPLMQDLRSYTDKHHISIEVPSSRLDKLDDNILKELASVKKGGLTLAPEAGTQRLRDVINKNITEEEIYNAVNLTFSHGWNGVKLYFMIGLPTEKYEDYDGIITILNNVAKRGKKIRASISVFTPKVHTPFQWEKQLYGDELKNVYDYIKKRVKRNVHLSWRDPFVSFLEGVFSRADRTITPLLLDAVENDIFLDGWDEYLKKDNWKEILKKHNIDEHFLDEKSPDDPLPWDIIDIGIPKSFFLKEREKAYSGETTPDCIEKCTYCGVCDKKTKIVESKDKYKQSFDEEMKKNDLKSKKIKYLVYFSRTKNMKFISQKNLINIVNFSLMRSGLPIVFSEGFSPHPKVSFCNPAPLGIEVQNDFFEVEMSEDISVSPQTLSSFFPDGFDIIKVEKNEKNIPLKHFKIEMISFLPYSMTADKVLSLLENEEKIFFDPIKKKEIKVSGIMSYTRKKERIEIVYDNSVTSMKRIIQYLFDATFNRYDLINLRREKITYFWEEK